MLLDVDMLHAISLCDTNNDILHVTITVIVNAANLVIVQDMLPNMLQTMLIFVLFCICYMICYMTLIKSQMSITRIIKNL